MDLDSSGCSLLPATAYRHRTQLCCLHLPPSLSHEAFVCKQTSLKVWGNEGKELRGRILQKTKKRNYETPLRALPNLLSPATRRWSLNVFAYRGSPPAVLLTPALAGE